MKKLTFFIFLTSLLMFSWTCVDGCAPQNAESHEVSAENTQTLEIDNCGDENCSISANLQILSTKLEPINRAFLAINQSTSFQPQQIKRGFPQKTLPKITINRKFTVFNSIIQLRI